MKFTKLIFIVLVFANCSKSDDIKLDCEVVINADGPGYLQVTNNINSKVEVFLSEYAFAAIVRANTCEIYGLDVGTRKAEISICADNDCDNYSDKKNITFLIKNSETHKIEISRDFFD